MLPLVEVEQNFLLIMLLRILFRICRHLHCLDSNKRLSFVNPFPFLCLAYYLSIETPASMESCTYVNLPECSRSELVLLTSKLVCDVLFDPLSDYGHYILNSGTLQKGVFSPSIKFKALLSPLTSVLHTEFAPHYINIHEQSSHRWNAIKNNSIYQKSFRIKALCSRN